MAKFIKVPGPDGTETRINVDSVLYYIPSIYYDGAVGIDTTVFYFNSGISYQSGITPAEVDELISNASN